MKIQWGSEIRPFEIRKHFKGQISNGQALYFAIALVPTILSRFQMVFDKMAGICSDFRSHSKSGPFATQTLFKIQTSPDFRYPLNTQVTLLDIYKKKLKLIGSGLNGC